MLVRRLGDAPTEEWHRLRNHILMDAGELGSRNMSVTWLEVPAGIDQDDLELYLIDFKEGAHQGGRG